jgi:class 3 adenylate cyclase
MMLLSPVGACWGSVARPLAGLATLLGRWDEAERLFEEALERNARLESRPWLAHTQREYAEMLASRGGPGDRIRASALANEAIETARELGMKLLVEHALSVKLRLQASQGASASTSIDAVAETFRRERPDVSSLAAADGDVTLVFSDMEGFTEMTERLGDARAHQVIAVHNQIVRKELAAFGGAELELQGDGFLLAFDAPERALACAISIQRAFAAHNARQPAEPIRVRIGLHTGEAIRDRDKFFGKTVIAAARIAALAKGGEILASSAVRKCDGEAGGFAFSAPHEVALKGLSGTYEVHSVAWTGGE